MATARGAQWSVEEVEAIVADYFRMLRLQLAGQPYSKTEHRRRLLPQLRGRSEGSIEMKHQNITAVLMDLGCVHIPGYKPARNYQRLLWEVVSRRVANDREFDRAARQAVERHAEVPDIDRLKGILVEAPRVSRVKEPQRSAPAYERPGVRRDYLEIEARNRSLGRAGELFVATFEARRLHASGHKALAERVEHVSETQGDGRGYDVLSFEPSGRERYIEVKTTAFGAATPFYLSRNEIAFSEARDSQFVLARVHEFRIAPKFFELKGSVRKNLRLDPVSYIARL
jgi:hypothetical protein